jgi:glycosyltransferase involved in cell wall biosynthesis
MKVAIAHDSITQLGGAERVVEAIHEIYPDAPVFTLVFDKKLKDHFEGWTIVSSPLQYLYNIFPKFQYYLPLIPLAVRFFDFSKYDVVISSSSVFIKGIHVPKNVLHINYCHTPARFLWDHMNEYLKEEAPKPLKHLLKFYLKWMQGWDLRAANRVDYFVSNSKNIQTKVKNFYKRDSAVIHPFVDVDYFHPTIPKEDYYLVAGRLQGYKKADLVIELFNKLDKKLHVVGTGRAVPRLKEIAGPNIQFLGRVEDHVLRDEFSGAKAYIYPQEEDFGMMPLEANACGTPVIALGKGGALETVVDGKTGVHFAEQSEASLKAAIERLEQSQFLAEDLFEQAQNFSRERFKQKMEEFVNEKYAEKALEEIKA